MGGSYEHLERATSKATRLVNHTLSWDKLVPIADANGQVEERVHEFCVAKRIHREALEELGTRIRVLKSGRIELAYAGRAPNGSVVAIKYRPLDATSHESYAQNPSTWLRPIIVGKLDSLDWLIAEGETDGARLWELVGDVAAVMVLPAGARTFKREWGGLIPRGATVALCHDADPDGDAGAEKVAQMLGGRTLRIRPPVEGGDWCDWDGTREEFLALLAVRPDEHFAGLSHGEVLALEFPPERMLMTGLVPMGAVGTIAGVPETHKSWLAQALAVAIAKGEGEVLEQKVEAGGPVGYFWQDDSTREEAERIKLYESVHESGSEIDLRWHLNEGLRLPADLERLRLTIEHYGYVLVVLDSFYNVLFGKDLKDEAAEQVIAELKMQVCDQTGCTVLIVDHMPWATQDNRQRLRAYGGVHKGAAIRFGIYIDAVKNKLYIEARGNNITGFKRRPCEWDATLLELQLIDATEAVSDEEYEQRILDHLAVHPNEPTHALMSITGTRSRVLAARTKLLEEGRIVRDRDRTVGKGFRWNLSNHAGLTGTAQLSVSELAEEYGQYDVPLRTDAEKPSADAGSTGTTDPTYHNVRTKQYGSTTGTPRRGAYQAVLPTDTPAEWKDDDDIPF